MLPRRALLASLAAALASLATGCGASAPPPAGPAQPELPPLHTGDLARLLTLARLRWIVLSEPRAIAAVPWLIPPIATVVPEDNLNRFASNTGIDLRQIPEAIVAAYAGEVGHDGETTFYLCRHNGDPSVIERSFRARLVASEHRTVERADVIRVSGKIGTTSSVMVLLGRDVVGFQSGGSPSRGPARIAALYATDKLKKAPTVLSEDPLKALTARLGPAPVRAMSLGPFEGELARGARGLLAGATAIGAAARPSAREGILVVIAVMGDFSKSGEAASRELVASWNDLANGSFGRLLGLDQPIERPLATHANEAVAVAVEIHPQKLARGLASATSSRIQEIMR
jgi:hypothetical protein